MSLAETIRQGLEEAKVPPSPYLAEYELPATWGEGEKFQTNDWPGLLFFHLAHPKTGERKILSYWATREHFELEGERFRQLVQAGQLLFHGAVRQPRLKKKPLLRRISGYTLVLGIAAFLGALNAIGDYFDWLFQAPYLLVEVEQPKQLNFSEGEKIDITLAVSNQTPVAHRNVKIVDAYLQAMAPSTENTSLTPSPALAKNVPPNTSEKFELTGHAPDPGRYQLVLKASATAGLLRKQKNSDPVERTVVVWPLYPSARASLRPVSSDRAILEGNLRVGAPALYGLDCELLVDGQEALSFGPMRFDQILGKPSRERTAIGSSPTIGIKWSTQPLSGFQEIPFQIALEGKPTNGWRSLGSDIPTDCEYRRTN